MNIEIDKLAREFIENRKNGIESHLNTKYGLNMANKIRARARSIANPTEKRTIICQFCGKEIKTDKGNQRFCNSACRYFFKKKDKPKKYQATSGSSICFDCVNWNTCVKKSSNVKMPFMTKARMVKYKNHNCKEDSYILRVDECKKYKSAMSETKEERIEGRKKLYEHSSDNFEFLD